MQLTELIQHPEKMDRDTLYELRSMLALHPYFQTVRLLLLQNLYLLHDPTFHEELKQAAVYITDRNVLFEMIEAAHYRITGQKAPAIEVHTERDENRTLSLIDDFLDSIPKEEKDEKAEPSKPKRKPTPADAAIDYVAYLIETEAENQEEEQQEAPLLIGQNLIDTFIENDKGKIVLNETPTLKPEMEEETEESEKESESGYFTETLARIYIKQGRYDKALEIIRRLSLQYPKKNAYFADQIRFLEKLIINDRYKKG